jgi:[lysine-biosynthesis-protein LysW]--L-2-aminoadipate ligase
MRRTPFLLLASRIRVEEKMIMAAMDRRGVPYRQLDTRALAVALPAADGAPVARAALHREIGQTRGRYAARLLAAAGVPGVNTPEVIETCGDKLLTSLALDSAGVPTPRTTVALGTEAALSGMARIGYPVVVKPLVGSWGRLAAVVRDPETARTVLEHRAALPSPQQHIVYVQELIDKPDRDIRVVVVGDRVLGAIYRRGPDWRTNVARGADSEPCPLTDELVRLARGAARAVGGGVLGVDLVEDRDGRLYVLEVNNTVEFRGFQAAHGEDVDVAGAIVDHLLAVAGG